MNSNRKRSATTCHRRCAFFVYGAAAALCSSSSLLPTVSSFAFPSSSSVDVSSHRRVRFHSASSSLASSPDSNAAQSTNEEVKVIEPPTPAAEKTAAAAKSPVAQLTHADIEWRLLPPEGTSRWNRWKVKIGAKILRLDCKMKGLTPPPVLCPKGGRSLLEAHYKEPGTFKKSKIARFGITTTRGPSCEEIDETIRGLYKINPPPLAAAIAAIVYMYVEPDHRGKNVGGLALEVISAIHTVQGVDFTVLVADDDGSGKLVDWYEQMGYAKAPLLQGVLGSPGGEFGTAMIHPVGVEKGFLERCRIKWW